MKKDSRTAPEVSVPDLIKKLHDHSESKRLDHCKRLGIPTENSIGVSTQVIRKIARSVKKNNKVAVQLWDSGFHEARLLAVLCSDPESFERGTIQEWMEQVISWDLCDHLCNGLIRYREDAEEFIRQWINDDRLYFRRAALATIANLAVHRDDLSEDSVEQFVEYIKSISTDERLHVKKAASWALRELGKRSFAEHDFIVSAASDLLEVENRHANWVARDALRELETLVKVPERKRLLSSKSKMGKKAMTEREK